MNILQLASKSLFNRKTTTALSILSIALSVFLLLGIERLRLGTQKSFESTVSGVDLIVGARSGSVNLLLYSVFRIGDATNNISYQSYQEIAGFDEVDWSIPISLGDSHRGFRVIGTDQSYFKHYQYSGNKQLNFSSGREFQQLFEVVLGSEVAKKLNYKVGDKITLSHGTGEVSFQEHKDKEFQIVGILKPSLTPVDQSLHVSLEAITALHIDWNQGAPARKGQEISMEEALKMNLKPSDLTAAFVKLKSKMAIFNIQRKVNDFQQEALMAILPGVALRDLWKSIGAAEKALFLVSLLVFIVSISGMLIALLSSLNERRREMAILRSIGAKKSYIFSILILESLVLSLFGILLGTISLYIGIFLFQGTLEGKIGLRLGLLMPSKNELIYICFILMGALFAGILPAWQAYRNSLSDGLSIKS